MSRSSNTLKNYKKHKYSLDYAVLFLISISLIFLMFFTEFKLNEVITSDREALLMEHDADNPVHLQLAEEIVKYRSDACKMIEVYSDKYEPIISVQFRKNISNVKSKITDYNELIELFENNPDGHTEVTIGDEIEDIYFRWTYTTTGEKCLFLIYMSRPIVENLCIIRITCLFIMILVVGLVIRTRLHDYDQSLKSLQKSSIEVQNAIFK